MRSIVLIARKCFDFVSKHFPSISNYVERTYGISSELLYGEFIVSASSGVQQGDPLSPALFCLILQPLLKVIAAISDIKVFAYLDDTYIFGPLAQVESALSYLEGPASGLFFEQNKALVSCSSSRSSHYILKVALHARTGR